MTLPEHKNKVYLKIVLFGSIIALIILGWFVANHQDPEQYKEEKQFIQEIINGQTYAEESTTESIKSLTQVAEVE